MREPLPPPFSFYSQKRWTYKLWGCCDRLGPALLTCFFPWVTSFKVSRMSLSSCFGIMICMLWGCFIASGVLTIYTHQFIKAIDSNTHEVNGTYKGRVWDFNEVGFYPEEIPMAFYKTTLIVLGCLTIIFGLTILAMHWRLRRHVRKTLDVPGSECRDFAISIFCCPCSLCQMENELTARRKPYERL